MLCGICEATAHHGLE